MATQRAVADAFFRGEGGPATASNFRIVPLDDGYSAALIGDDRAVFAVREPIDSYTIYNSRVSYVRSHDWHEDISNGALQDQHRLALRSARHNLDDDAAGVNYVDEEPPVPDEIDHNVNG
jgi:hypothetical protein